MTPSRAHSHAAATRLLLVDTRAARSPRARRSADSPGCSTRATCWWSTTPPPCPLRSLAARARGEPLEIRLLDGPYEATTRAVLLGARRLPHAAPSCATRHRRARAWDDACGGSRDAARCWCGVERSRRAWSSCAGRLDSRDALCALYRAGRPVQYSYVRAAARAVGRADHLRRAPVGRGDAVGGAAADRRRCARAGGARRAGRDAHPRGRPELDRRRDPRCALPLPERYEIPRATVRAHRAHTRARRARDRRRHERGARTRGLRAAPRPSCAAGVASAELILEPGHDAARGVRSAHRHPRAGREPLPAARGVRAGGARSRGQRWPRARLPQHEFGDAALFFPDLLSSGASAPRAA